MAPRDSWAASPFPLRLANGRILLPNNRAVRTMTEAFVRVSGGGLVLPKLIAIGDRLGVQIERISDERGPHAGH